MGFGPLGLALEILIRRHRATNVLGEKSNRALGKLLLRKVRDPGAIINEQVLVGGDSTSASVLFTGHFGINLSGLPGARSDAAFGCFPPPVRGFWPYPSSTRKGRGCYRSDGAVKLGTPPPFRKNLSA